MSETRQSRLVLLVVMVTLGSGVVNLWSVTGPALSERAEQFRAVFPLEFVHLSRFVVLLIGFTLIISSLNLYRRKKRALQLVTLISLLSIIFHLTKGLDFVEALFSGVVLALLALTRKRFTVESSTPNLGRGILRLAMALCTAFAYGVFGFWVLDNRQFGIDFSISDAVQRTLLFLSLMGDPGLIPRTRYAVWFLDSLYLMTVVTFLYGTFALFRPVVYRYGTLPYERARTRKLTEEYGRSSLDYFKYWIDKSFFFSRSGPCVIAYRVGGGHAMVLGDPAGPEDQIEATIREFENFCQKRDWRVAFHCTLPDFLPIYRKLGYHTLKIGDNAIVDLSSFSLETREFKKIRKRNNKLEKEGVSFAHWQPPVSDQVLSLAKEVSDDWLTIPGRRERTFSLGLFAFNYLRQNPLYAALDSNGRMLAFVNGIPSFAKGEATIDLMRHRVEAPNAIMDYVFSRVFSLLKEKRFLRFSMGLAPMAGFRENEEASPEEQAVHYVMQHLNFLFSYQGLRRYKAKFATVWEPRYLIYRNALSLPRVARAIARVSEIHHET